MLELKDESGAFVSGVYVGFTEGIGLNIYARFQDNTGYNTAVPAVRESYPLAYIPVKSGNWHRIDLKTVANTKGLNASGCRVSHDIYPLVEQNWINVNMLSCSVLRSV